MTWSAIAIRSYYGALAICGAVLVYFLRPHFDTSTTTLIAVAIVALFLLFAEHPTKAASVTAAPLTAIIAASMVLFGWWALPLAAVAWGSVHWRMRDASEGFWRPFFAWAGQVGQSCLGIFVALLVWDFARRVASHQQPGVHTIITMVGIICVGMLYQTTNNVLSSVTYILAGRPMAPARFASIGLIAAVYGYLLVAVYNFSGIIGTAIFYVFVGQERMVQGVLGLTAQVQQLYHARTQARALVSDLMRFADAEQGRFAEEVQMLSQRIAKKLGLPRDEIAKVGLAAELHEIGKARLPAKVRATNPSGEGQGANGHVRGAIAGNGLNDLAPQELAQLRTYPRAGALMVRQADALLPGEIAFWIECHDEHFDGSGFPRGLRGDEIPLPSRIIAVAREFVRLTIGANGDYETQKASALASVRERSGTFYDPKLVQLLEETVAAVSGVY